MVTSAARPRHFALAFSGGADAQAARAADKPSLADAQAARAAGEPSLAVRNKRGGSMERTTCVTPQRWRISVDGNTVAFGTASLSRTLPVLSSRVASTSALVVSGWSAAHSCLLDPAAVLSSDILAPVFASLSLRERLQCAAVCRAWRRLIAPAPPAVPDGRIWKRVELPFCYFLRHDWIDKLVNHVLPRWGSHIRELSLRCTYINDVVLRAVVAGCPHLRHLDVRECSHVFCMSCENPNLNPFSELMVILYERALPSERFTLLMSGSGFAEGSEDCGERCNAYLQLVTNSLALVSSWPVKSSAQDAAASTTAWLQCDLAAVCTNWGAEFSDNCDLFIENPIQADGVPAVWRTGSEAEYSCDLCKELTCEVRSHDVA